MNNTAMPAAAKPLRDHNALEAAVFAVELEEPPSPAAAEAIRAALRQFEAELPGEQTVSPPNGFFFSVGAMMPSFGEAVRFMAKPNGEHSWRVQLVGNVLQVACFDYSRFGEVWPKALRYLRAMLAAADQTSLVAGISHQYLDKFIYPDGMPADQYDMEELFQRSSRHLTAKSWDSGSLWHVYQGWFDNIDEQHRVLNQINITNTELGPQNLGCIVDHRCMHQVVIGARATANALAAQEDQSDYSLDATMRSLHDVHKTMLKGLLQPAKLLEIGMED